MAIQVGDRAPNFSLISTDKEEISLDNFKGSNLVLLFFPLAFTGVCTEELCTMRDSLSQYNDLDSKILAVSVDSPFTLDKFKSDNNLNFTLASDFNAEACAAYGSKYDSFVLGMRDVAKRSAFVIDGKGQIKYAEVLESAGDQPNYAAIKSALNN